MEEINNIIKCICNARIELEQGGKYDCNSSFQSCDEWLKDAIKRLEKLKSTLTFSLNWEKDGNVIPLIKED